MTTAIVRVPDGRHAKGTHMTTQRGPVRGVTDILHQRGQRDVELLDEHEHAGRTTRTWQVTSTWTCTAERHGSIGAVKNDGCVCPDALIRRARYEKDRRTGQVPPLSDSIGVRRRLQALAALGYPSRLLAARMDVDPANLWQLRSGRRTRVSGRIKQSICALYEELSGTPGPSSSAAKRARAKGWAPPLAWDDETIDDPQAVPAVAAPSEGDVDDVAVERALHGEQVALRDADRREVARRVLAAGGTPYDVSRILHMNTDYTRRLITEATA